MLICYFWKPDFISESHSVWFQRSGAIGVFFSLMVEFRLSSVSFMNQYFSTERHNTHYYELQLKKWNEEDKPRLILHALSFSLAAFGTFTWAYGDLTFKLNIINTILNA